MQRYEVIPAIRYRNIATNQTVSAYGAVPNHGDWVSESVGFTIRDNQAGTVGIGRAPFLTFDEALRHLTNNPHVFRNHTL